MNAARLLATWSRIRLSARPASRSRKVLRRNSTNIASSASVSTVLRGELGPIGASSVVVLAKPWKGLRWVRHLATVVRLSP